MAEPVKIDCHIHIYRSAADGIAAKEGYTIWEYGQQAAVHQSRLAGTVAEVADAMKAAGIAKAIVVNLYTTQDSKPRLEAAGLKPAAVQAKLAEECRDYNSWACDAVKPYPGILAYVGMDVALMTPAENVAHLKAMVAKGARGVKLHGPAQGFSMADERLWPVYAACRDMGLPIIAHSGPDSGGKGLAEPRAFGAALKAFPDLPIVLAHMGGATWRQVRELAATHPNAHFDVCEVIEWTRSDNGPSDSDLARLIKDIGPSRVMMGSDYPWYDLDHTVDRVMSLPLLSAEEKAGIVGANAMRVLRL